MAQPVIRFRGQALFHTGPCGFRFCFPFIIKNLIQKLHVVLTCVIFVKNKKSGRGPTLFHTTVYVITFHNYNLFFSLFDDKCSLCVSWCSGAWRSGYTLNLCPPTSHGPDRITVFNVFLGNICIYSHAIGLAIQRLVVVCHDFGYCRAL